MMTLSVFEYFNKSKRKFKKKIDSNFEEFFDVLTLHAYLKKTKFKIIKHKILDNTVYRTNDPLRRYLITNEFYSFFPDKKNEIFMDKFYDLYDFVITEIVNIILPIMKIEFFDRRFTLKGYV